MDTQISVITATRNVAPVIEGLYESLCQQDFPHFEWIVMDGQSTDATPDLLQQFASRSPWVKWVSEPDFGLYHAINKGIGRARGSYYVVAGADDLFNADALSQYAMAAQRSNADVVLARVSRGTTTIGGLHPHRAWLGHAKAFPGSHSVGMLFRRELHDRFGLYSRRFPLLADGYFLKLLLRSGTVRFMDEKFVAGRFAEGGLTTVNKLQILAETWQIQMMTERNPLLQSLLFLSKLAIRFPAVSRELSLAHRGR